MSHHIVSIDAPKCKVYVQNGQLFVATESVINSVPLEDVASIVITSFKCDIAHSVFVNAAKLKIGVVFCESYSPVSVLLPVDRATDTQLIRNLAGLSVQSKRRLWKKTVDAKCVNQFSLALKWSNDVNRLKDMEISCILKRKVKSLNALNIIGRFSLKGLQVAHLSAIRK